MTEKITAEQLVALAIEADQTIPWLELEKFNIDKDKIFHKMAENIIHQMESVPAHHVEIVCMATITKLLVENFTLSLIVQGMQNNAET